MSIRSKLEIDYESYADPEEGLLPYLRQCMVTLIRQEDDEGLQRMVNDNAKLSEALYDLNDEIGKMFGEYEQMRNKRDAIQKALEEKQAAAQALIEEMEVKFGKDEPEPEPEPEPEVPQIPNIAALINFDDDDDDAPESVEEQQPAVPTVQFDDDEPEDDEPEPEPVQEPEAAPEPEPESDPEPAPQFEDPFEETDVTSLFDDTSENTPINDLFAAPIGADDSIYDDVIDTGDVMVFEDEDPSADELPYVDDDEEGDLFDDLADELDDDEPEEPAQPAGPMDMNSAILEDDGFFD